ncbi:hypothetical protein GH733_007193 [Mirounga leonina]|nr:hypothetical protein GH733_007193 [Mirounga leonina]
MPGLGHPRQARWTLMLLLSMVPMPIAGTMLCERQPALPALLGHAADGANPAIAVRLLPLAWSQGAAPWRQGAPFALSALLYGAHNNLVIYSERYMDPSTYQVLSNLKIGSTALFCCLCLWHRLSARQGLALQLDPGNTLPGPPSAAAAGPMPLHIAPLDRLLLILSRPISGLSSVYPELLMKRQRLPLALQNLFLYPFDVLLHLGLHAGGGPGPGLLEGFSGWAALAVLSQALNGLLVSAVMKHGHSITRLLVVSCSLVVNAVLSAALLRLQLMAAFLPATPLTGVAVHLYYGSR